MRLLTLPAFQPIVRANLQPPLHVVLILPFEPKMTPKAQLEISLRSAVAQLELELFAGFERAEVLPVIKKIQQTIRELNFATHKRSLVMLISADHARVIYMEATVDQQIILGRDFRLRDFPMARDTDTPFLALLLSARRSKMFQAQGSELKLIKSNKLRPVYAYSRDLPEKVANFSDPAAMKENLLEKFLRHMDEGLSAVLNAYPLPVFVIGTDRVTGHFCRITKNKQHIVTYIHHNAIQASEQELLRILAPYLADWQKMREDLAIRRIETALDEGRLAAGLGEVSRFASAYNCRLLVIERGYEERIGRFPFDAKEFYIKDQIDAIIAKVLGNGGRIEWVDGGKLARYDHIALVRQY